MNALVEGGCEIHQGRDRGGLHPKHYLGKIFFRENGHDRGVDESAESEHRPTTTVQGTAINIGTEKADQEHQADRATHAAMIHVVGKKRGVDVGDLGGRNFCVLEVSVAFGVVSAKAIEDPFGKFSQVPSVTKLRILPVSVEGDDAAKPVGAESLCYVRKIVGKRSVRRS